METIYIVWHDNGIKGQCGYSEHEADIITEENLRQQYQNNGITIYKIEKIEIPFNH